MTRTGVYITRKWGQAEIEVSIYKRGETPDGTFIELRADLETFKLMLKNELQRLDVDAAVDNILADIKAVTSKVMK